MSNQHMEELNDQQIVRREKMAGTAPHRKRSYRRTGGGRFELSARKTGYACTHNNGGDPRKPPKLNPMDRREVPHRRAPGRPPNDARSPSLPGECAVQRCAAVRARSRTAGPHERENGCPAHPSRPKQNGSLPRGRRGRFQDAAGARFPPETRRSHLNPSRQSPHTLTKKCRKPRSPIRRHQPSSSVPQAKIVPLGALAKTRDP